MRTWCLALLVAAAMGVTSVASAAGAPHPSTRGDLLAGIEAAVVDTFNIGCCTDTDVVDFGHHLDFTGFPDGYEVTTQYRNVGMLFGEAATVRAPKTVVRFDYSRPFECRTVLNGDPVFQGWEFFIFVDPVQNKWATVQRVGADVGYADYSHSSFLAAYDINGNLLEAKFNTHPGFQFLKIVRPSPDIARVMTGECLGSGGQCYPDPGGSAINCLTYSSPVSSNFPLPSDPLDLPPAPTQVGAPVTSPALLIALAILLAGFGAWWFRRTIRREIA